ncbi:MULTISPECIES: DUF2976 domain-containing protein [Vibrio]|uniref:DUF2976 domain-containing protein n=1 Tax=Vibrio TaxID=662 RepID=UPI0009C08F7A|nr:MULTISPECIES: DUF2976 domain-containing protein [Vibrio]USD58522.1 DUF2976 domain-containing protein [Vibrio sp. SCSIO 43155]
MINTIKRLGSNYTLAGQRFAAVVGAGLVTTSSNAALPTPVADTVQNGDYMGWFKLQFLKGYDLFSIVASVVTFFVIAAAIVWTFIQVQKGKKDWSDLFLVTGVGAAVMVFVFWLLNQGDAVS